MRFDPASGSLLCDHCGGKVQFDQSVDVQERDFSDLATFSRWDDGDVATYRCYNCGAVTVAPRTAIATTCPYCNSPVVIDDKTGSLVKPDSLIPFQLTAKQAAQQLSRWRKRRLFAPNKFRKHTREDSVKGVFVPAWTFDATTTSSYNGTVGIRKTRTVRRNGKTYTESYIDWGACQRSYRQHFRRRIHSCQRKHSRKVFSGVATFSKTKLQGVQQRIFGGLHCRPLHFGAVGRIFAGKNANGTKDTSGHTLAVRSGRGRHTQCGNAFFVQIIQVHDGSRVCCRHQVQQKSVQSVRFRHFQR